MLYFSIELTCNLVKLFLFQLVFLLTDILESTGLSAIQDCQLDVSDVSVESSGLDTSDGRDCVTLLSQSVSPKRTPVSPQGPGRLWTAPGSPAGPGRLWSPPSPVHDSRTRRLSTISTGSRHSVESGQSTTSKDSAFSEGSRHSTCSRDSTGIKKSMSLRSRHSASSSSRYSSRCRHLSDSRTSVESEMDTFELKEKPLCMESEHTKLYQAYKGTSS